MKSILLLIMMTLLLVSCASKRSSGNPNDLEIVEINETKLTALMKQNMLQLAQVYDLGPFLFTKKIHIMSQVVPHSHPVLTLNTRNAENPKKILSVWLHEELHWWTSSQSKQTNLAIKELKKIYPRAPATKASGPDSTYLHLIVCYLEFRSLAFYLGEKEAIVVISDIMKKDKIYPWVYYQVLKKNYAIRKVIEKYQLYPSVLKTNKKPVTVTGKKI